MTSSSSSTRGALPIRPSPDPPLLWLPLEAAATHDPPPVDSANPFPAPVDSTNPFPAPLRPRILVAEDDPGVMGVAALVLHLSGFEVTTAEDGEAAWRIYLEQGCDLLLTDHNMPRLSGLELIARVRTHGDPLPVILTSGLLDPSDIPYPLCSQIDAVLAKPFSTQVLVDTVRRCLRSVAT